MTNDIRDQILALSLARRTQDPSLRYGQSVFNAAYELFPEEADRLRGDAADPFYQNDNVDLFLERMSS